ncbi:hypothetical protein VM1G_07415 [Cytospora mali]|uniref:Uncharacterized protein n=1 Tax=Cytospora mali TaxID=578113 RepID=A0A194W414_CYTMA|nr:hypothetical protein VM1G_07415 [Valsa mali]
MADQCSSHSINVTNDYGTPNLLFFYHIPLFSENMKDSLAAVLKDYSSWNSWELFEAEKQLQIQLQKETLPKDDTIESREKRTAYRAKVIAYLRENSEQGWLLLDQAPTPTSSSKTVKKVEANSWIRQTLRSHYADKPSQVGVIFNIISNFIASNLAVEHKYYLTDVTFKFNTDVNIFQPTIRVSYFTINQTPQEEVEDSVTLSIDMLDASYHLDRSGWSDANSKVKDEIAAGEKIRQEMMLDLLG